MSSPYATHVSGLLSNAASYHQSFYDAETFHGPSLYFHQRALQTRHSADFERHLEYVYATLVSWGMHRMGPGGSKMQPFVLFRSSAEGLREQVAAAQAIDPARITNDEWNTLRSVFCGIKVMASGTSIVGNSKVMHHMIPNIVPPIDREYTFRFLRGNTSISNDLHGEWATMRTMIEEFFIPVVCDQRFAPAVKPWLDNAGLYAWDTSPMKVVDNLIIGSRKLARVVQPQGQPALDSPSGVRT